MEIFSFIADVTSILGFGLTGLNFALLFFWGRKVWFSLNQEKFIRKFKDHREYLSKNLAPTKESKPEVLSRLRRIEAELGSLKWALDWKSRKAIKKLSGLIDGILSSAVSSHQAEAFENALLKIYVELNGFESLIEVHVQQRKASQ